MNNYFFNLPEDIIEKIYFELHKIYMKYIKKTLLGNLFFFKIKRIYHFPITYTNYYL
jgi:hypothetical protein